LTFVVTARKWRPKKFSEVIGQDHITTTLKNALINNRIGHAYIFAGPRGIGKTTTARILAKALNCLNPQDGEPCNECDMCKKFDDSQTMDVIEIDGASNRRIEEIRTLRESVKYAPTIGKYKIYIIDEVHMLTTESFNALLKTLEEPPEHTIFVFATTDVHKVPLTIVSRCQRFDFRRIELKEIKSTLKTISAAENIKIDDESLTIIAKKADGALRDAESIFDQVVSFCGKDIKSDEVKKMLNLIDEEIYFQISDSILNKTFETAFNISTQIYERGWNYIDFLNGLVEHFRNLLTVVIRKDSKLIETSENFKSKYLEYKDKFSEADILRILTFLNNVQTELKFTQNPKLKIEVSLSQLIGLEKSTTITKLLNQLKKKDFLTEDSTSTKEKPVKANETHKEIIKPSSPSTEPVKTHAWKNKNGEKDFVFEKIIQKWIFFIDQINLEKFTLGSIMSSVKPVSLEGNVIKLKVEHSEDASILKEECEYLRKKGKAIFGNNVRFEFSEEKLSESEKKILSNKKTPERGNSSSEKHKIETGEDNPLIVALIEKLGAREISH